MSSSRKLFFIAVLLVSLVLPVLAGDIAQGAGSSVTGSNNVTVIQRNEVHTDVAKQFIKEDIVAPTYVYINNEAPVDMVPNVNMLGVGDADTTYMLYPNEVMSFPAKNQTYLIKSGGAIAVYLVATGRDRTLLDSSESMLTYDPIYHRFDHGVVSPAWIWPKFTTKCTFSTNGVGYIVLDNRYFPDYTMVEVIPILPEDSL